MSNPNYTHITIVVDRSGSMRCRAQEANQGINALIKEHTDDHKVTVRLSEFDHRHDVVADCIRIEDVKPYRMNCGGMTALIDGIGYAIDGTQKYITRMGKGRRPGIVLFVVVTDGGENSSSVYSAGKMAEMVAAKKTDDWQFTFMGADPYTVNKGRAWGFDSHEYDLTKSTGVYQATSTKFKRMRTQKMAGLEVVNSYTQEEMGMFEIK